MKFLLGVLLLGVLLVVPGITVAQTSCRPDYNGGYICSDSRGDTTTIRPDYNGGWNTTNRKGGTGTIRPDYNGGWNIQQPPPQQPGGFGDGFNRGFNRGLNR